VQLFDELGVARAGNGTGSSDSITLDYAQRYSGRIIAFAGGLSLRQFFGEGERSWNLQNPAVLEYLDQLETALRAGQFEAIGELYPNNLTGGGGSRYPADSPLMQRLWALSATYQVPLSVHMDATEDSVAEMERLLASDRRGIWIWAHTGTFADTPLLRRLLQAHPNLHCELSARLALRRGAAPPAYLLPIREMVNIAGADERLRPPWKALLEEFPDRFVIGTDVPASTDIYRVAIDVWRHILEDIPPETAAMLAHRNAERLLRLAP
jgi:hypothetical protein